MHRVLLVAKRDYLAAVKNKGFLIGLIVAPLVFGGTFIAIGLTNKPDTKDQRVAIVDHTEGAAAAIVQAAEERMTDRKTGPRFVFEVLKPENDLEAHRLALSDRVRRGELFLFLEIGPEAIYPSQDKRRRQVSFYTNQSGIDALGRSLDGAVNEGIRRVRLMRLGMDKSQASHVLADIPLERMSLVSRNEKTGQIQEARSRNPLESFLIPFALTMLLMMVVMVGSSPMLGAVAEDKMQRVHEMLLVSASPFELMMGKVLSALGVSLTSSTFYIIGAILALQGMAMIGMAPLALLPWFFVYLVADVLMLSALGAGLGAACSSPQDAQSLAFFLVLPVVIPSVALPGIIRQPNGAFATALSFFPPFTPLTMLLRQAMPGGVPAWQPWVGLAGVVVFTLATTWAAARIFRVGILVQGKPPRLGELAKWVLRS